MKYLPGAFGSSTKAAYPNEDVKADNESDCTVESFQPARPSTLKRCLVISITLIAFDILGYTINRLILSVNHKDLPQNTSSCRQPAIRKEWRSLGQNEKTNYIAAVQCLSTHPSTLNSVGTWNDDFAWIHKHIGMETHFSAAFLSWHRYFISVYETLLKDKYWDWSQDSSNISNSPVWDIQSGFGGNGNVRLATTLNFGRCVTSGPFANLTLQYEDADMVPHCFTRGFAEEGFRGYSSSDLQPAKIDAILNLTDYTSFYEAVENGPHDTVPNLIRGDFWILTAPNDPIFFLHHANLDRLWWSWQQKSVTVRLTEYAGPARSNSSQAASLNDSLPMVGFAGNVTVADIIDTVGGQLCYTY